MARHLTQEEKMLLRKLVDEAGAAEVLRVVGVMVAHDTYAAKGQEWRAKIFKVALEIQGGKPLTK